MGRRRKNKPSEQDFMNVDKDRILSKSNKKAKGRITADCLIDEEGNVWKIGHKPKATDNYYIELGNTEPAYRKKMFDYEDAMELVLSTLEMLDTELTDDDMELIKECACRWISHRTIYDEYINVPLTQVLKDASEEGHYADALRVLKILNLPYKTLLSELKSFSRREFEMIGWEDVGKRAGSVKDAIFKARQKEGLWLQIFLKRHYNFNLGWYGEGSERIYLSLQL